MYFFDSHLKESQEDLSKHMYLLDDEITQALQLRRRTTLISLPMWAIEN